MAQDDAVMDLLRRFGKAFNRGDIEGILACVTDDFEWRLAAGTDAPDGKVVRGKEAVRQALEERDLLLRVATNGISLRQLPDRDRLRSRCGHRP